MGHLMPEFYRLLKATRYDQDDVVRLHIQLALEELKVIVIDCTAPQKKLTKKIHILDRLDEFEWSLLGHGYWTDFLFRHPKIF